MQKLKLDEKFRVQVGWHEAFDHSIKGNVRTKRVPTYKIYNNINQYIEDNGNTENN